MSLADGLRKGGIGRTMFYESCIGACVVYLPFAVLSFLWYRQEPTRERLAFFLGWFLKAVERPVAADLMISYCPAIGPNTSPEDFRIAVLAGIVFQTVNALPDLIIGVAFLTIVVREIKRARRTSDI
jgi:hypothetical protein